MKKKIVVLIWLIVLMLVSSGMSVNAFEKDELSIKSLAGGNLLITEWGNNQTIEVDGAGNIVWQMTGLKSPQDAERLTNGNILITEYGNGSVTEFDSAGSIVWQKTGLVEPTDAERLANGNTLITDFGGGGSVIEVDSAGSIVWQKTGLSRPFDAERLSNGNTLIAEAYPTPGRIIEVDSLGNEVWNKSGLVGPLDVERLSNGNTLITEHIAKQVTEVDSAGNIVWSKTGLHVPKDAERLPNGNTLIADCGANRIIEVDSAGSIVWQKTGLWWPVDVEVLPNEPPEIPTIVGKIKGKSGKEYEYTISGADSDGDELYVMIDWGDNTSSEWLGPFDSSYSIVEKHSWEVKDSYTIKAKARDPYEESEWGTLNVTMPKNKLPILDFLVITWLLERFPNVFPVLRYMLGM